MPTRYEKLLKKFRDDPDFYRMYHQREAERRRKYAENPVYREKQRKANQDYRYRKARGLPLRQKNPRGVPLNPLPKMFDFTLVPEIKITFD